MKSGRNPLFFTPMEVIEKIKELVEPLSKDRGYMIVDITYKREGGRFVLKILADKPGGISMDECADLNNELSELLDKGDLIQDNYVLEVSSPGLDRKLKKDEDFVWAVGRDVRITTYRPFDGKSTFSGVLVGLGENSVVVDERGTTTEIPRDKIASAKLNVTL